MVTMLNGSLSKSGAWLTTAAITLLSLISSSAFSALPSALGGERLPSLAPMLEKTTPAVVNISTRGRVVVRENPLLNDPFFRRFFNLPGTQREKKTQSLGSGVIVDAKDGYVLTNHHVIEKAQEITVTLRDGRKLNATLVGADPDTDVAVIQIDAENLSAVALADSEELRVGDFVVAIGNPFGLGQTVTSGIVSALGRSGLGIEGYENFIQTDASINPGNSGGALVNLRGELVGINTAILAPGGGNVGIGFAIPSNMARDIMKQLVAFGEVRRGLLGVVAQDLTPELAEAFDIPITEGAVIVRVGDSSPAQRAGLRAGDIVTSVNDRPVRNAADVRNAIGLIRAGGGISLTVIRNGTSKVITAKLTEQTTAAVSAAELHSRFSGAQFADIEPGTPLYGRVEGVLVLDVERRGPAWSTGLRKGDIITAANRRRVKSVAELKEVVSRSRRLMLNIQRGNSSVFLMVQ